MRTGGKNDSGREEKFSLEAAGGGDRVTKSCISCVSHSTSSPSSSDISSAVTVLGPEGRKSGNDLRNRTDSLFEF